MNQDPNQGVPTATPPMPNTTDTQPQPVAPPVMMSPPPVYTQPQPVAPPQPQPVVQPQPQQPSYPVQVPPQSTYPSYAPQPKKGGSKLWIIIAAAVGGLLLIAAIVFAVITLSKPSKADYEAALKIMTDHSDKIMAISTSDSTAYVKESAGLIDSYVADLGDAKAMRDKEVKDLYDKLYAEYQSVKPVLESIATVSDQYKELTDSECTLTPSISSYYDKSPSAVGSEFDQKAKTCLSIYEKMKSSTISEVSDFAESRIEYYKDMRAYYVAWATRYSSKDYSSAYPKMPSYPTTQNPLTALTKKLSDSKMESIEDELSALLQQKAS